MSRQMAMPGFLRAPTRTELKAYVAQRLEGFEARQAARSVKRAQRLARARAKKTGGGK
jgi:hypothetical protein